MKIFARILLVAGMMLVIFGLMQPTILIDEEETLFDSDYEQAPANIRTFPIPETETPLWPTASPTLPAATVAATSTPIVFVAPERPTPASVTSTTQPLEPEGTPVRPAVPLRLVISSIGLDTPVVEASWRKVRFAGRIYDQYKAPENAAGWHPNSALLGEAGNTVLNGHNNTEGEVFRYLEKVKVGDIIHVFSADQDFAYIVTNTMLFQEAEVSAEQRLLNASWIGASDDERLTLVSCWPYVSNTFRLIVVARPLNISNTK